MQLALLNLLSADRPLNASGTGQLRASTAAGSTAFIQLLQQQISQQPIAQQPISTQQEPQGGTESSSDPELSAPLTQAVLPAITPYTAMTQQTAIAPPPATQKTSVPLELTQWQPAPEPTRNVATAQYDAPLNVQLPHDISVLQRESAPLLPQHQQAVTKTVAQTLNLTEQQTWPEQPQPSVQVKQMQPGVPKILQPAEPLPATVPHTAVSVTAETTSTLALATTAAVSSTTATSVTPASQLTMQQPLYTPAGTNELSQQMVQLVVKNQQQVTIHTRPAELGPIQIQLQQQGQETQLQITTSNGQVRQAIETALPQLREQLQGLGLQLGETQVSEQRSTASGQSFQREQQGFQQQQQQHSSSHPTAWRESAENDHDNSASEQHLHVPPGHVDLFA
ncbi:flagellar hook-length control protein FliK [Pseudidiomarina insulisalsae]|uniref:Flagellar hook-length control protein-like C-terminal domain-containing protein n=1 Tax=Pseudidiomarina insulisalsae TaxID=575789 RepID=A0A432YDZ5_9GAMM|nr:flagellar hook-length control protein FliK [Pseudidiomarina insulisalsae]RUO59052.1 hypothetical protein CWI71_09545 [Pseudidiomarina insulisalsae]